MKKSLLFLVFFTSLTIFLSGCSDKITENKDKDDIEWFSQEEKALEFYISEENIKGTIEQVETINNEKLLISNHFKKTFTIGEMLNKDGKHSVRRISAYSQMEIGAQFPIATSKENDYSVTFSNVKETNEFMPLPDGEFFLRISGKDEDENVITSSRTIKTSD